MTASITRTVGWPVWLVACLALLAPAPAIAADGSGSPSAKGLWSAYPLHPRQTATAPPAQPTPFQAGRTASSVASGGGGSGGGVPAPLLGLIGLAALGAGGALAWTRLRRRPEPASAPVAAPRMGPLVPLFSGAPATMATAGPRPPRATTARGRRTPGAAPGGAARSPSPSPAGGVSPLPADVKRAWTAEIEWRHDDGESRFWVTAEAADGSGQAAVAQSPPLEWPPNGPAGVQALADAAKALEDALLAAGWKPLPPGGAWYAKRFSWKPEPAPAAPARPAAPAGATVAPGAARRPAQRPAAAREPAGRADPSGRFSRAVADWPEGAEAMWRCELKWDAGYFNSRFQAIAYPPGGEPPRPIGASPTFRWMFMDDPDPRGPRYLAQVRGFASALEAAGWERIGRGHAWYAQRFVWRRKGTPPDHVEPTMSEPEGAA